MKVKNFLGKKANLVLFVIALLLIVISSLIIIDNFVEIRRNQLRNLLLKEKSEIESLLLERFNTAFFLIEKMGKEIVKNPSKKNILEILQKYKPDVYSSNLSSWTIFSWSNDEFLLTVDAEYGIMVDPISLADRDYVQRSIQTPWERLLGRPVFGSTSRKWMIPGGIGITNLEGVVIGTLTVGFEIEKLAKFVQDVVKDKNIDIEFLHDDERLVFAVKRGKINLSPRKKEPLSDNVFIDEQLQAYPYNIILTYNNSSFFVMLLEVIRLRIGEVAIFLGLFFLMLFLIYKNNKR